MSGLRSAIDEYLLEDPGGAPDAALEEDVGELLGAVDAIEAALLRKLVVVDRRRFFEADGFLSTVAWLVARFRISRSRAAYLVRLARSLEEMPDTGRALLDGEISAAAASMLAEANRADAETFAGSEQLLVEAARSLSIGDLQRAVAHWKQLADDRKGVDDIELHDRRGLHVSPTVFGMVRVDGNLDPEGGQCLIAALRSIIDAEARSGEEDSRTPSQKRADALHQICREHLDCAGRPAVAGERPHVNVVVDLEVLERRADGRCELDDVGPVSAEVARRLACDAELRRIVTRGRSEVLDVGRSTSVPTAAMRASARGSRPTLPVPGM